MKIGIFGGSFNPFHTGHRRALESFIKECRLDRVFVIPTSVPPHKIAEKTVSDGVRLEIAKLSTSDLKNVEVSDFEILRGGKSYTYITLEAFREKYKNDGLYLYVGSDMLLTLDEWKEPERIFAAATVAAFSRTGDDLEKLEEKKIFLEKKFGAKIILGRETPTVVSSTEIRQKARNGEDISSLVVPAAEERIKKAYGLPTNEEIIGKIKPILKESRFRHSLGVAKEITELAALYGCDIRRAEVAGLLHDATKNFPDEWHLSYMKENGFEPDEEFLRSPQLFHAVTGSFYARNEFGIEDEGIISAIRYHTTAKPDMTLLETLLYVSDFTEPTRTYDDVDYYRKLARKNIYEAAARGLIWNIENLKKRGSPVYFLTVDAAEFYKSKENIE